MERRSASTSLGWVSTLRCCPMPQLLVCSVSSMVWPASTKTCGGEEKTRNLIREEDSAIEPLEALLRMQLMHYELLSDTFQKRNDM